MAAVLALLEWLGGPALLALFLGLLDAFVGHTLTSLFASTAVTPWLCASPSALLGA